LRRDGRLVLAEVVPRQGQRLSALVDLSALGETLASNVREAEAAMYQRQDDPRVNWDLPDLEMALRAAGFAVQTALRYETQEEERHLTSAQLRRWFRVPEQAGVASYASHLLRRLSPDDLPRVEAHFRRHLQGQVVPWRTTLVYVAATAA
jgi:hypothetical protein